LVPISTAGSPLIDPAREKYKLSKNTSGAINGREKYKWDRPHFASPGLPVPLAFKTVRLSNHDNMYKVTRPLIFEFNDNDPVNASLLEKITNAGTGSNIIDFTIRNKFDTVYDWSQFIHDSKSKEKFPKSTYKTLGANINNITDKFDPNKKGASNSPISTVLKKYNLYQEWISRIFTILDTADTSGMLTEYVKRGLLISHIDDSTKRVLEVTSCFDWSDLETNKPDFYANLNFSKADQVFANNKALKILKLETVVDEQGVHVQMFDNVPPEQVNEQDELVTEIWTVKNDMQKTHQKVPNVTGARTAQAIREDSVIWLVGEEIAHPKRRRSVVERGNIFVKRNVLAQLVVLHAVQS